jgi:hypothetical protein
LLSDLFNSSVPVPGEKRKVGRYVTLAAVMGMTMNASWDECVLTEDMMQDESCSIRLYGIGRAVITGYYNRLPTVLEEGDNDEINDAAFEEDDEDYVFSSSSYLSKNTPIIMGEFASLSDVSHIDATANDTGMTLKHPSVSNTNFQSSMQRSKFLDGGGVGSIGSSPVAAIAKLSKNSNQIIRMHQSRQNLVNGIKAANSRLKHKTGNTFEEDGESTNFNGMQHEAFLKKVTMRNGKSIMVMDNLGLSYFGALAPFPSIACEAKDQFQPYYSEAHQEREEWDYEVQSYMAWKVLEGIISPRDMAWSLLCTSTAERLQEAYEIMYEHRTGLQAVADVLRQELLDCGEECTDLF